jgi:hypothetical protein
MRAEFSCELLTPRFIPASPGSSMNGQNSWSVCASAIRFWFVEIKRPVITDGRFVTQFPADVVWLLTTTQADREHSTRSTSGYSANEVAECRHQLSAFRRQGLRQSQGGRARAEASIHRPARLARRGIRWTFGPSREYYSPAEERLRKRGRELRGEQIRRPRPSELRQSITRYALRTTSTSDT